MIKIKNSYNYEFVNCFDLRAEKARSKRWWALAARVLRLRVINPDSPHDLYSGLYPERMRGRIGVTWTLRIYQLPSLAHLLYRYFVSSETFGNRPWRESVAKMHVFRFFRPFIIFSLINILIILLTWLPFHRPRFGPIDIYSIEI